MSDPVTIAIGLVSHTNAGKTTLARTLLRRDIGEIGDRAHVTEVAQRHVMIESPQGDVLALWDTPGFGDSMRLFKRLSQHDNPLAWALTQTWDRVTDRPFWSGQQVIANARDECDVVLYVINATESPEEARYIDVELRILDWIGKPVVLLLNQIGPPRSQARLAADMELWRAHLSSARCIRGVLTLDAFARCWVQEDTLLAQLQPLLRPELQPAGERLRDAWRARNRDVFERSMQVLARQLAQTVLDEEPLAEPDVQQRIRGWISSIATGVDRTAVELTRAERAMSERVAKETRAATDELIQLHGLSGRAAAQHLEGLASSLAVERPIDSHKATVLGGLLSGAAGGLAADLAAGGLTFGAGALIGSVLGALGARGATQVYNVVRGRETGRMRWSPEFMSSRVGGALLTYLEVAHFGRGRGEYVSANAPEHFQQALGAIAQHKAKLDAAWEVARTTGDRDGTQQLLAAALTALTRDVLRALYPDTADAALGTTRVR
jgi:GTPase SAR1 family protein